MINSETLIEVGMSTIGVGVLDDAVMQSENGVSWTDIVTALIAVYAAIVSTGALALEVRRWFESGPRLSVRLMCHAQVMGGYQSDSQSYIVAIVTNKGVIPTTITHFGYAEYSNWFVRIRRKSSFNAIVPRASVGGGPELPYLLQPGTQWTGAGVYNRDLLRRAKTGNLFVVISSSHSSKGVQRRVALTQRDIELINVGE